MISHWWICQIKKWFKISQTISTRNKLMNIMFKKLRFFPIMISFTRITHPSTYPTIAIISRNSIAYIHVIYSKIWWFTLGEEWLPCTSCWRLLLNWRIPVRSFMFNKDFLRDTLSNEIYRRKYDFWFVRSWFNPENIHELYFSYLEASGKIFLGAFKNIYFHNFEGNCIIIIIIIVTCLQRSLITR